METHISPEAAGQLVEMAGDNLLHSSSEIGKMATYLNGEGEITADVIESLVPTDSGNGCIPT